jgi:subtilisin family serine protease
MNSSKCRGTVDGGRGGNRPRARHASLAVSALALAIGSAVASAAWVDPQARITAAESGAADVLIAFDKPEPSLAPLAPDADYRLRRRALVDALVAQSDADQAGVRAWLEAQGVDYRSYWIANVIAARVDAQELAELARRSDIRRIVVNARIPAHLPQPEPTVETGEILPHGAVAWGVAQIDAPAVWAMGYTGQGVVIAGQDTGYDWDHPALKPQYRGWNGSIADHDYNWHDAIHDSIGNSCGNDAPAPCDDDGHGTHTAGTFAGDDQSVNRIGVAPGARWIGCRNMDDGVGTPARYIECMQWFLAPTDLAGNNPEPDLAPDIASNSWGCPPDEGCTAGDEIQAAVENVVAGGIFFAAAAGNAGSACGTILDPPAIYDASFVVGATDDEDRLAGFSSRGPVPDSTEIRPDLSAPGVSIRSSFPGGGYGNLSGTSMATPHVAGAAALLMSIDPDLKGHPAEVAEILRATAVTDGIANPFHESCGGIADGEWPNFTIGYGRLDVHAAALMALERVEGMIFTDGFDGDAGP